MRFVLSRCHNKLHLLIITNMEFAMNLKIVNDTIFDLNYYLVIDNKERYSKSLASGAINEIVFQHGQLISIEKK